MSDDDLAAVLNDNPGGFNLAMGLRFVSATREKVVAEWSVGDQHKQPYGIVHGGVYSAIIETLCSAGAALIAMPRGQSVVGLENHTSFLRAVREGTLRCTATPLSGGKRSQVWEGVVHDEESRVVAKGTVRLICLEQQAELAGEKVEIKR